jgi:hypothetical protein
MFYDRAKKMWPLNTGDCMGRFDCICAYGVIQLNLGTSQKEVW